jgi:hypothetical protein
MAETLNSTYFIGFEEDITFRVRCEGAEQHLLGASLAQAAKSYTPGNRWCR